MEGGPDKVTPTLEDISSCTENLKEFEIQNIGCLKKQVIIQTRDTRATVVYSKNECRRRHMNPKVSNIIQRMQERKTAWNGQVHVLTS